jgi:hypothetical protein
MWATGFLVLGILTGASPLPKFMGRQVTIIAGEHDSDGFPLGPASICLEGAPRRQCYTPPKAFGNDPTVEIVQLQKDEPALLFSAATYGVSGWSVHFALLAGADMEDLFADEMTISNQSQHAFWHEPGISESAIFLTAEFVQGPGPDEGHYGPHRFIISAHFPIPDADGNFYYLQDRYMTVRKYDYEKDDILAAEKPEILARLQRVKAAESAK